MKRLTFLIVLLLMYISLLSIAQADLTVYFLDVGQADASLIICDGETLMIDGGNSDDSSYIYSFLTNTLGLSHIDYMIATHPHEDHIGGLSGALNACSVGMLYSPYSDYDTTVFDSLKKYADRYGVSPTVPAVGDTIQIGSATLQFLSPSHQYSDINDMSIVVRVTYGNVSFLFTGDAEWEAEHDIVESGYDIHSSVLKVGHHGSDSSSSYIFLRDIMPEYAIISVGAENTYGHPADDVISRLSDAGAIILRTDVHGTIIITSDGESLNVTTERTPRQR